MNLHTYTDAGDKDMSGLPRGCLFRAWQLFSCVALLLAFRSDPSFGTTVDFSVQVRREDSGCVVLKVK